MIDDSVAAEPTREAEPLDALEQRIETVLRDFESGTGGSWAQLEDALMEGYGRLLALEAASTRLRTNLGRFKARGLAARRRFQRPPR